jgi:hypothetical protein
MRNDKKIDSRALRALAEDFITKLGGGDGLYESEKAELVTSLVRQLATYDGRAVLFLGEQALCVNLGSTPLGNPCLDPAPGPKHWLGEQIRGRNIDPDEVPDITDQLNRGQSAEATTIDGGSCRFWVNPREGTCGVEVLTPSPTAVSEPTSFRELAAKYLRQRFGDELPPDELVALAGSVAKQWKRFDGHADVFVGPYEQVHFQIIPRSDRPFDLKVSQVQCNLDDRVREMGFSSVDMPRLIAGLNLDEVIELTDAKGARNRLWHDPKEHRFVRETMRSPHTPPLPSLLPSPCPKCLAMLVPSSDGRPPEACPLCGHAVPHC